MTKTKTRLAAVTLTAAAALVPLSITPAHAASYITVCNSGNSEGEIKITNTVPSPDYVKTLYPGQCSTTVRDDGGGARVDVDPPGGWIDVDSWTKRKIGEGWPNTCYESENHASDPYSLAASYYGTDYWVFQHNGCTQA